jgi:hypothetical protein
MSVMVVLFEGQLERKSGFPIKPWKSAWVVIKADSLEYSDVKGAPAKGSLSLQNSTVVSGAGKASCWQFTVANGKDKLELATPTEEARSSIVAIISSLSSVSPAEAVKSEKANSFGPSKFLLSRLCSFAVHSW